jgi:hypothetical protein
MPFLQADSAPGAIEHMAADTFATNAKAFVEHLMSVTEPLEIKAKEEGDNSALELYSDFEDHWAEFHGASKRCGTRDWELMRAPWRSERECWRLVMAVSIYFEKAALKRSSDTWELPQWFPQGLQEDQAKEIIRRFGDLCEDWLRARDELFADLKCFPEASSFMHGHRWHLSISEPNRDRRDLPDEVAMEKVSENGTTTVGTVRRTSRGYEMSTEDSEVASRLSSLAGELTWLDGVDARVRLRRVLREPS